MAEHFYESDQQLACYRIWQGCDHSRCRPLEHDYDAITKTCGSKEKAHTYENLVTRLHGVDLIIISNSKTRLDSERCQEISPKVGLPVLYTRKCVKCSVQVYGQTCPNKWPD
jgi:hypothetical protein